MDYKKLYEKAVERAKTLTNSGFNDFDFVKHIFPELAESEDEKIRKALIDYFNDFTLPTFEGLEPKKILAWLEKQGEHANFLSKIQVGDKVTRNEDGVLVNLSQLKRVAKPANKQGEQKPAWSEEDEYYYGIVQYILNNECVGKADRENAITWYNFLKDRVQPQPKQEWSEEDETMTTNIIIMLKEGASLHFNKNDIAKGVDWLKSLRPQNRWKPSDKQMEILWKYAEQNNYDGFILTSLHQQLKKLRE